MKNNYSFRSGPGSILVFGLMLFLPVLATMAQSTFVVTTTADSGEGSLREAINKANADVARDVVQFNIPGEGPHEIILQTSLPNILEPVVIDATTQPTYSVGFPTVVLAGNGVEMTGFSLVGNSSGSKISGFVIGGFRSAYSSNAFGAGIVAHNSGSHEFSSNFIGVRSDGLTRFENEVGISLVNSSDNVIGGPGAEKRNVISGNKTGLLIDGGSQYSLTSERNSIIGNYIGTDSSGELAVSNTTGIRLRSANNNVIGGTNELERNIISGNSTTGITLSGHRNKIMGNFIGTNTKGAALGNGFGYLGECGIKFIGTELADGSPSTENLIGGSDPGAGNVISGNNKGIVIYSSVGTKIQGNRVGTDLSGYISIPNKSTGMELNGEYFLVGGPNPGEGNLISTNSGFGQISIGGKFGKIQGNLIGTDASGKVVLSTSSSGAAGIFSNGGRSILVGGVNPGEGNIIAGNAWAEMDLEMIENWEIYGNVFGFENVLSNEATIMFDGGENNFLGGTEPGMANVIRGGKRGVRLDNMWMIFGYPTQIKMSGNSIYGNGSLGIEILPYGINNNDSGDSDGGLNRLQNFPVISEGAEIQGGNLDLSYFVDSAPQNATYPIQVEFFIQAGAARQAKEYLFYNVFTEEDYNAGVPKQISVPVPIGSGLAVGNKILSTATDAGGNTSEFSTSVEVGGTCSAPVAACISPFTLELNSEGLATLAVEDINNGSTASCGLKSMTIDRTQFTCADIGEQTITLSVTDINDVTVSCSTTITIKDSSLPELTPVSAKEVTVDENCQFTVPDYTGETIVTDNCGTVVVTQVPVVGTVLAGHNTTQEVILTADDGNGNANTTSFIITLKDLVVPVIPAITDKEVLLEETCNFMIPDYRSEVAATDNCSTPTLVQTPSPGVEISGHGTVQEITIEANDGNGNTSSTSFYLTLIDKSLPTITAVEDQVLTANENCEAMLEDFSSLVTVNDICDLELLTTQDPAPGTVITSETMVTLTVIDDAENIASTQFLVSLEGGTTTTYYLDNDGDGIGVDNINTNIVSCVEPETGYSTTAGDCNDNDGSIFPGSFDIRGDGIDQDCVGGDEPLNCIGTDMLDITQICPQDPSVESWAVSNPSTCSILVTWTIKNSSLSGSLVVPPGTTSFNTPLTTTKKTIVIIYWADQNGREKRRTVVSKGTDCTSAGVFSETEFTNVIEGTVYPNPIADNGFWISFPPETGGQSFQGAIYNMNGQLLIQKIFDVPSEGGDLFWSFNHDSWQQGLYPLVLTGSSHQIKITLTKS